MALKQIRIHHSSGRYRIYECSFCGKHISRYYAPVQSRGVQSCGCLRNDGGKAGVLFTAEGVSIRKKPLPAGAVINYRGVEKTLSAWLAEYKIPRTVFNRWYLDGRRPTWIIARYANGVRREGCR